jgi:hypothetical protein
MARPREAARGSDAEGGRGAARRAGDVATQLGSGATVSY